MILNIVLLIDNVHAKALVKTHSETLLNKSNCTYLLDMNTNLIHLKVFDDCVKADIDIIQKVHNLK